MRAFARTAATPRVRLKNLMLLLLFVVLCVYHNLCMYVKCKCTKKWVDDVCV
jgi:hypothetical protein